MAHKVARGWSWKRWAGISVAVAAGVGLAGVAAWAYHKGMSVFHDGVQLGGAGAGAPQPSSAEDITNASLN